MNVVYLPLDERPCNYRFAGEIARGTGVRVIKPDISILGDKKRPADFELLSAFMLEHAREADSYVISLDMLLYGGIVPSRLHYLSEDELRSRLAVLDEIKRLNPSARIYAFALIMRCPRYSSGDEEPDYYEYCGKEIFLTGQAKHKRELGLISDTEADELIRGYSEVTGDNLADYEARRVTNRNMLIEIVKRLHSTIDYLIIPQDDSAEYGYTSMDREAIKSELRENGLDDVPMYPGADEVGMTLLARAACEYKGVAPKIFCEFSCENAPNITPLYEDRPLRKTLPYQIGCAGCVETDESKSADIMLYLNYPSSDHVEVWQEATQGYFERDIEGFTESIRRSIEGGRVVALADGAYCNGGDREFLRQLSKSIDLLDLSAYAGWNTSSNTLGTAICQAVFAYLFGNGEYQKLFTAQRVYEDVGYCGFVRAHVTNDLLPKMGYNYFDAGEAEGEVAALVREELVKFIGEYFPDLEKRYSVAICRMPWRRMFEVDLTLERSK